MSRYNIIIPTKDEIENMYSKEGCTISSLARHYKTSNPTVRSWLIKYEIERKSQKQASTESNNIHRKQVMPSKDILEKLHNNHSQLEIAKMYNVTQATIHDWLFSYDIEINHVDACKRAKDRQFQDIQFSKEELELAYDRTKPMAQTAEKLNISYSHLKKLFKQHGIQAEKIYRSNAEIDLFEYMQHKFPYLTFEHSNKTVIYPYELDIVCHEKKIAIEYCGLYWHSEVNGEKKSNYHKLKYSMCKEKGYKLITIFESDDMEKIKALLDSMFGVTKRVYARNTIAKQITSKEASTFNKTHHIHGAVGGSHHFGLFYEDKIIMVISFSKTRFNKKYEYECARMTSHSEYSIIGGASKLFKFFIDTVSPNSIITYADLRFGDGNVYNKCNFIRKEDSNPNYWYFYKNTTNLYSRVKFQKHKLKDQLEVFDDKLTEFNNMVNNGWDRIWDCGNAVYVWEK